MSTVTRAWMYLPDSMTSHDVALDGPRAGWSWCGQLPRSGRSWRSDERLTVLLHCRICAGLTSR